MEPVVARAGARGQRLMRSIPPNKTNEDNPARLLRSGLASRKVSTRADQLPGHIDALSDAFDGLDPPSPLD